MKGRKGRNIGDVMRLGSSDVSTLFSFSVDSPTGKERDKVG